MHYLETLLLTGLLLASGCCHVVAREVRVNGASLVATYRLGHDDTGFDTVQCYLSNVGDQAVYISDRILCSWTIEPKEPLGHGESAAGAFWFHGASSPVPALLRLDPVRREVLDQGWIPDVSLPISGRLFVGEEKVHVGSSRLVLSLDVIVHRDAAVDAESIDVKATKYDSDHSAHQSVSAK